MRVEEIMKRPVVTCRVDDTLNTAARLMWENDCGAVPVLGEDGAVVGMITDRDICMAAYTQGTALGAIPVCVAMSREVFSCHPDDPTIEVERLMQEKQVRRMPVVDPQGRPIGILSLNDLAREAARATARRTGGAGVDVLRTLAAIGEPRARRLHAA